MFSKRLRFGLEENELWKTLSRKRSNGDPILDLTQSNPTAVGLDYPTDPILRSLAPPDALRYAPEPTGLETARVAVAGYYRERGARVSPNDVVLTASTSEAYSYLFKLLCEPGDGVLVPRPSYPLFDFLAALDGVELVPYSLDHGAPSSLPARCRAAVAVHPNNPTGAYLAPADSTRLIELAARHEAALIVDEVFLDYGLDELGPRPSFAGAGEGLVFVLSGLSKLAGLPQMKLSWIVMAGDDALRSEARSRLEHIADTYLSVGTPVQLAAPRLLELASSVRASILSRVRDNLDVADRALADVPEATLTRPEGGWTASMRLPAIQTSEGWARTFLEEASVYLHPGSFFGFESEAFLVLSLLPEPDVFSDAMRRVLRVFSDRLDSSSG